VSSAAERGSAPVATGYHRGGSPLYIGMPASHQAISVVLLAGSVLLCSDLARMRVDPLATLVAGGLVVLACLSIATMHTAMGW